VGEVRTKVDQAISATRAEDAATDQSSALRVLVWDVATDLIAAHPIAGTGTGDIKDELVEAYTRRGFVHAAEERLNAHSQFLQTAATLGLPGLMLLVLLLGIPLIHTIRMRDHVATVLLLSSTLNWAVESMLEVQAGVVFFSFFALLLSRTPPTATRGQA
jgi:O-antigen ligase